MSDFSTKLSQKDMGKEGISSAVGGATQSKGVNNQPLALEQNYYYQPNAYYDYYYPGINGAFAQSDEKGFVNATDGSYTGAQPDNYPYIYYVPGYGPYTPGYMGADGKPVYASEAYPCYTYDLAYSGNGSSSGVANSGHGKSNGFYASKTPNNLSSNASAPFFNSKLQTSVYQVQNQPQKTVNKLGYGIQSAGFTKGYHPAGKLSPFPNQNNGFFMQYNPVNNYRNNNRNKSRDLLDINGEEELTRGPRGDSKKMPLSTPDEVEPAGKATEGETYNLPEFETEYDNAKFYVIKSYSEDDIHKSIKYNVWSSTRNGNKKLATAFSEANAKTSKTGTTCPIFLFFSVNGSGQFVGVAEMIGQVDFEKNMDFWQLDKWTGCFPIKWHMIKDVPNILLRHIVLKNNENRPVTFSRDTQEIELPQGLEMLTIFKGYPVKTTTCVLDDFDFYEKREKSLKEKRNSKTASSQTSSFNKAGEPETVEKKDVEDGGEESKKSLDSDGAASLMENLSLDYQE